jgi:hypothetical protein
MLIAPPEKLAERLAMPFGNQMSIGSEKGSHLG